MRPISELHDRESSQSYRPPDGKPMHPLLASQATAQAKLAARIRRLIRLNKLSRAEACRAVGVGRMWYYRHKHLIEQPTVKQQQPA